MRGPSTLADRLRGILNAPKPSTASTPSDVGSGSGATPQASGDLALERVLGGEWCNDAHGSCFVVERRFDGEATYGQARVGDLAENIHNAANEASIVAGGAPARPPFVFFDLETTGLSGGAGTYAFLVGCGSFDDDGGFVTRQYVLARYSDERPLLATVAKTFARAGALVSFNGKSFDAPVLETRYLFHRLEWIGARLPHLDVLHPARRFWGEGVRLPALRSSEGKADTTDARGVRLPLGGPQGRQPDLRSQPSQPDPGADAERASCSLIALERHVLGARRVGDVPGVEIPARYFQFVRNGDPRPLEAVLEHNRLDLLSLAGLTARLLQLVSVGPCAARDAREALALGRVYWRAGLEARACEAYEHAAGAFLADGASSIAGAAQSSAGTAASIAGTAASIAAIRIDALRALALASRRARRHEEAAALWRQLLEVGGCPSHIAREATEALAIHHEHRVRDLGAARAFALRSMEGGSRPARADAVRHRLARIERKMAGAGTTGARLELGD